MGRYGHEVAAKQGKINGHLAEGLNGIGMYQRIGAASDLHDVTDRLDHARLIVDEHDADKSWQRTALQNRSEFIEVHETRVVDGNDLEGSPRAFAAPIALGCSTAETASRSTGAPCMAKLFASVPPEVKTTIAGKTPRTRNHLASAIDQRACLAPFGVNRGLLARPVECGGHGVRAAGFSGLVALWSR